MSVTPPENYTYGTVVGRFLYSTADGTDADRFPDLVPATGTVTFTPNTSYYKNTAMPATFINTPIAGALDSQGYLVDSRGARGVYLMATDNPDISPSDWTYKVTMTINGRQFTPFDITVTGGDVIDLTTVMPASTSAGTVTLMTEEARIAAEAAAASAAAASSLALAAADEAREIVTDGVLAVAVVTPIPDTIPKRTSSGGIEVGEPTSDTQAMTLGSASSMLVTPTWKGSSPATRKPAGDYSGRYGVTGTGTDDRTALQGMLNSASQADGDYQFSEIKRRGVTVQIPAGVYLVGARSDGQPSLIIPEGVTADFSKAMLFFDYPAAATGSWSAILVRNSGSLILPSLMAPSGRNTAPGAPGTSNTDRLYDGVRILGSNNATTAIRSNSVSEIRGFRGASIRGIGAWITRIDGTVRLSSDYGYIASNWPSDNVYGYAHTSALPGIISGVRLHTDLYMNGVYFNENRYGGYLGVVTGSASAPHDLDYTRAGGHQIYFNSVVFEQFANWAFRGTGSVASFTDCAFEEVGSHNNAIAHLDSWRSVAIRNHRVNLGGRSVPGTGGNTVPNIPVIWRINSVQTLTNEAGYIHNEYNSTLQLFSAAATTWDVTAPHADAIAITAGVMYAPLARSVGGGYQRALRFGSSFYLWIDSTGVLRTKSGAPTSDTDGTVVGTQS